MFSVLKIEKIGNPRLGFRPAWVDVVTDIGPHGMEKTRLKGQYDYSEANSVGSRGVFVRYWLQAGELYHVSSPQNWKRSDQYFCFIDEAGLINRLDFEEAVEWLLKRKRARMSMGPR